MASAVVTPSLSVARAFSPGHITGFFDRRETGSGNLLLLGSTGAGFSVARGIETTVEVHRSAKPGFSIEINGKPTSEAEVSKLVVEKYLAISGMRHFIRVHHNVNIPIGYGLGSSGAGALSLSIALNEALSTGFGSIEAAQIAHVAEIECKTGLGTVIAEFTGGFEVRTNPGAPGIGSVVTFPLADYSAVILCMAPVSTKKFLDDGRNVQPDLGRKMLKSLLRSNNPPKDFLKMSFEFASQFGLTGGRCKAPLEALFSRGYLGSVALFGETVFTLVPKNEVGIVSRILRSFGGSLIACNVDAAGARPTSDMPQ